LFAPLPNVLFCLNFFHLDTLIGDIIEVEMQYLRANTMENSFLIEINIFKNSLAQLVTLISRDSKFSST
jgi:hypothetical protein